MSPLDGKPPSWIRGVQIRAISISCSYYTNNNNWATHNRFRQSTVLFSNEGNRSRSRTCWPPLPVRQAFQGSSSLLSRNYSALKTQESSKLFFCTCCMHTDWLPFRQQQTLSLRRSTNISQFLANRYPMNARSMISNGVQQLRGARKFRLNCDP